MANIRATKLSACACRIGSAIARAIVSAFFRSPVLTPACTTSARVFSCLDGPGIAKIILSAWSRFPSSASVTAIVERACVELSRDRISISARFRKPVLARCCATSIVACSRKAGLAIEQTTDTAWSTSFLTRLRSPAIALVSDIEIRARTRNCGWEMKLMIFSARSASPAVAAVRAAAINILNWLYGSLIERAMTSA